MTADELRGEMEKRINGLLVFVERVTSAHGGEVQPLEDDRPDDNSTVYRIRVGRMSPRGERLISALELSAHRDLPAFLDSVALYLVYDFAFKRYYRKVATE